MEDGVTEIKDLVSSGRNDIDSPESEEGKERAAAKESEEKGQYSGGGMISNLISAFVSKDSDEEEKGGGAMPMGERKREEEEEQQQVGEKEGHGLINHLISNLVSPLGPKLVGDENGSSLEDQEKGGGIFNNLISGILHHGEGTGGERDEGNYEKVQTEETAGGGGGGLIENIVSHLPAPLDGISLSIFKSSFFLLILELKVTHMKNIC